MRALVIHESLFGNTRAVAEAIAEGLADARPDIGVQCLSAARAVGPPAAPLDDVDLLVLGCPTHAWGMSSLRTRTSQIAKDRAQNPEVVHDPEAEGPGVRELVALLAERPVGVRAAVYDTRLPSRFAGGAAPKIARAVRKAGGVVVSRPTGFVVQEMRGPLRQGELERARGWGRELGWTLATKAQESQLRGGG